MDLLDKIFTLKIYAEIIVNTYIYHMNEAFLDLIKVKKSEHPTDFVVKTTMTIKIYS